jgi:site-specific recombinase XerD
MKEMRRTKKQYPYFERYPDPRDPRCSFYAFYIEDGSRKRRTLGTRGERVASKKFNELCQRLEKGVLGFSLKPRPLPFKDFARRYLKEATSDLSSASVERHRQNLFGWRGNEEGHLVIFFGKRNLKSLGVKDIARYIRTRQTAGASPNTIHKELATLSAIFRFALQEEIVLFNPVLAVKKPKLRLVRPNYRPTPAQILLILNALDPKIRRFFLAYCSSGCRKSELIGCNVGDADMQDRLLRVVGKGNKERFIPINDILFEQIRGELELRPKAKSDEPLFLNKEGRRFRTIRKSLERACITAKVPHIGHHSLRHAFATAVYHEKKDIVSLSKILGHANPTITWNIYVHGVDEKTREAAESFRLEAEKK